LKEVKFICDSLSFVFLLLSWWVIDCWSNMPWLMDNFIMLYFWTLFLSQQLFCCQAVRTLGVCDWRRENSMHKFPLAFLRTFKYHLWWYSYYLYCYYDNHTVNNLTV
jgi:hypothetical protein